MVRLPDPLALSTGVVPRLILAIGLSGLLWLGVAWAMSDEPASDEAAPVAGGLP
jgi:hypothetical protein